MSNREQAWIVDFDVAELAREAGKQIDGELESIARRIADIARAEPFPTSKTGNLVKRIRPRVSKFEGGGWIVAARAPHSHLVEYGHAMVKPDGTTVGHVPAHPFLRKAKNAVLVEIIAKFRASSAQGGA